MLIIQIYIFNLNRNNIVFNFKDNLDNIYNNV
jgi:hypothetical protein